MYLVDWVGIVQLENMFVRTCMAVVELVVQIAGIVRIVLDVVVIGMRFIGVGRGAVTIREGEVFAFLLEGTLIVEVCVEVCRTALASAQ